MVIIAPMLTRFRRALDILLFSLIFVSTLSVSDTLPTTTIERIRMFTRPLEFNYVNWTLKAFGTKLIQATLDTPFYFKTSIHHQIVGDYLQLTREITQGEQQLFMTYADPQVIDPEAASANLRKDLNHLYERQRYLAPVAEAVLQAQVTAVLADLGLTSGGQPIPPVLFRISPPPYELVVSRRDKIERITSVSLQPNLTVVLAETLEEQVDTYLDVSSLVVPVGGIGSYPTMMMQTTALDWMADTVAHEWIHNWLTLRPLGMNYDTNPELRTMNETTASLAGHEIALLVLKRYYPELLTQFLSIETSLITTSSKRLELNLFTDAPFNFDAEMYTTRVNVDRMLSEGKIEQAEDYMETRRLFFWENGYALRKLNQAYFAFYGAYADVPGGAAGEDPVGPAVRTLRDQSVSLHEFLYIISRMTSFEELQTALAR